LQDCVKERNSVLEFVVLESLTLYLIDLAQQLLEAHLKARETLLIDLLDATAFIFHFVCLV